MNRYLFVYGTLKASYRGNYGRDKRDRLVGESRLLGAATLQGRLYDLGHYPGVIDSDVVSDLVHGEVVELADVASFHWLDAYEGIDPQTPERSQYRREERPVRLADGSCVTAWVYVYALSLASACHIPCGLWQARGHR